MLAETADNPFDSAEHYFEPKWDGMRCIAYIRDRNVELQNRNLTIVTKSYPELQTIHENIKTKGAILDGEIVVLKGGLPSFEQLQGRFGVDDPVQVKVLSKRIPTTYIVFDLLHLNGKDLVNHPLSDRRKKLAGIIEDSPHVLLSEFVAEQGKAYYKKALQLGFEGAMAKRANSEYQMGVRSSDWLKLKRVRTMDCVIVGYTRGTGGRATTFGALVLAAYDRKNRLTHLGNVGTGLTDSEIERMMKILKALETRSKTLDGEAKAPTPIKWVKPKLVAEIGYMKMTADHKLRLPRFIRLRLDGNPDDCRL
jgi:bifunctional non-homologous end joining protein LigD